MSFLPQRKKTPEELAALREQELLNRVPKANEITENVSSPTATATPAAVIRREPLVESTKAPSTPRRKRAQPHGTPHLFDGLRPQEAAKQFDLRTPVENAPATLPTKKHDDEEILQMRRKHAFQTRPPVEKIRNMALHPILVGLLYLFLVAIPILTHSNWNLPSPLRWYAPGIGCSLLMLFAVLIYFTKPRARHHAAFLFGIAILTLGFCFLITINATHAP